MFWNWGAIGKDAAVPICLSYANDSFKGRGLKLFMAPREFTTIGGAPNGSVIVQVTRVPQSDGTRIVVSAFSDDNNLAETTRNNVQSDIQARPAPPRPAPPQVRID
jgi:hypothetical protein